MKSIQNLVVIGLESLLPESQDEIKTLVGEVRFVPQRPTEPDEVVKYIGESDGILISPHLDVSVEVLRKCLKLKYIGVYAKSLKKIAVEAARTQGIVVTNNTAQSISQTAEFCLAVMLQVSRGLSPLAWNDYPMSLKGKTLGILGFGQIGQALAKLAVGIGMRVVYTNRSRKLNQENAEIIYKDLPELLHESDVISVNVHPDHNLLTRNSFSQIAKCKLLINTSFGDVMDLSAFQEWVSQKDKFAVFDDVGALDCRALLTKLPNVYLPNKAAWRTYESIQNKDRQLIKNLRDYLAS